ncbi:formate dehydrogenase accessory sulfurtransferase FdhD [Aurantimonas sp. Leaf443]|uniref:formate dehydrogenase accessory sulfurtransferase FdhD n=1 Tax=Aurantimonas sp. Leaf443 TaxID=1736378 RepID=UPI0006F2D8B6|nr:formate dehydrogenase accessory sulfurtransferase FdhD [Aurantimonas sp. Leaf443]KQT85733.1 formate dehydrogenase family accessory protein FdhD [Aurantimonas sp. Leaf443]
MPHRASATARSVAFRDGAFTVTTRAVPAETAIAISVNGSTHAVMMATPDLVEELGLGLALNEGIVSRPDEIERIEVAQSDLGLDCRLWLTEARGATYVARRRQMTGPVGCGLCGVESLELARRALPPVSSALSVSPGAIAAAMAAMGGAQALGRETRAVHAASFHRAGQGMVAMAEDVGRHNALDKVTGLLARAGEDPSAGFIALTSRVSVELIQKAAAMGCGLVAAVSAPTQLAIAEASACGVTLVAVVRGAEFEIFTHFGRVEGAPQPAEPGRSPVPEDETRAA